MQANNSIYYCCYFRRIPLVFRIVVSVFCRDEYKSPPEARTKETNCRSSRSVHLLGKTQDPLLRIVI
jgi:hypothetical protein